MPGGADHQVAPGDEKEDHADEIDPGLAFGVQPLVDDIHAHMAVVKQGVTGADQKDESEQMPFQLLGETQSWC